MNIGGYPLILGDTAGLRETTDSIESIGIERAKKRYKESSCGLYHPRSSE